MISQTPFLDFAISFAEKAGNIIKKNFSLNMEKEWKLDNTPVTETDYKINRMLIKEVKKLYPTHSILGEEESLKVNNSEYVWVCDPVDGTIPFSHGIPTTAFGLALVKNGDVILAVANDPFTNRLYHAEKGKGAYLNGKPISVNKKTNFQNTLVAILDRQASKYKFDKVRRHLRDRGVTIVESLSVIYFACLVASGEIVASIFPKGDLPNNTPIKLLIEEAGGKFTDLFGNQINDFTQERHTGHIASNKLMHEELVKLVNKLMN